MLVIRQQQIQAMVAGDDRELEALVAEAVKNSCPRRLDGYDDADAAAMVRTAIARARSHGLERAEDVAAFAAVMFEIAPNFDEQAEVKLVLADSKFAPSDRFAQLFERVSDDAWAEAEKRYDELVWFPTRK